MAALSAAALDGSDGGRGSFYCSTSGTVFENIESLTEHYKSDFHRYNLKRKVAGLPPVTREWFEARKSQLALATNTQSEQKIWIDPLTKKKFNTENTYLAHTQSKKYKELLRKSGQPAPPPLIVSRKQQEGPSHPGAEASAGTAAAAGTAGISPGVAGVFAAGHTAHPQAHVSPAFKSAAVPGKADPYAIRDQSIDRSDGDDESEAESEGSDWETDDENEEWEKWDTCMSLFDSHVSASIEANLEYMQHKFGFCLPDREHLKDPEGLLHYLGAKMQYGKVPLYMRGDDSNTKTFRSLHAVQRHMVDTNQCKMLYADNEEEYADYYGYEDEEQDEEADRQLMEAGETSASVTPGYELVLADGPGKSGKIVGSREFQRYYKQRHKPADTRQSVQVNTFLAKYRALAFNAQQPHVTTDKAVQKAQQQASRQMLNLSLKANVLNNTPKNVPY